MTRRYSRYIASFTLGLMAAMPVFAASQDPFELPQSFLEAETAYLQEYPELQKVMDAMIDTSKRQLERPEQDILHNRVCAALVYQMTANGELSPEDRRLALAGDLLHNIAKAEPGAVLTDAGHMKQASQMVDSLKKADYFTQAPDFWSDKTVLTQPKVGDNQALIHHITGAVMAGDMLAQTGDFTDEEIEKIQAAVTEHSTGYWYFRASIDEAAGKEGAWKTVYPQPESDIAKYVHDADLISQFVPESVVPDGAKWRELAKNRWGATTPQKEGHIVYYVFMRLFDEAQTASGKEMARERWDQIAPKLKDLMKLKQDQDPIEVLGVPSIFAE